MTAHQPPATSPQPVPVRPRTRRQQRRIDRTATKLDSFLAAHQMVEIYPHFTAIQLMAGTGLSITKLSPALRERGWRRDQVRIAGTPTILWTPPGYPSPLRERGRPRKLQPGQMPTPLPEVPAARQAHAATAGSTQPATETTGTRIAHHAHADHAEHKDPLPADVLAELAHLDALLGLHDGSA